MFLNFARRTFVSLIALVTLAAAAVPSGNSLVEQGRSALGRGDTDGAIAVLEKAVAQDPKNAEAHYCLANSYATKVQETGMFGAAQYASKIKGEFETAVALKPGYVEARMGLVQVYASAPAMMGGSIEKAFEQAKAIQAMDPLLGHRANAFVYAQQKNLELARKEYTDAVREQPASPKAHTYFGQYLANTEKNYASAFTEFEAALKADPAYMPAWYQLGRAAAQADSNLARGEQTLRKYLGYTPQENEPTLANAHYWLGAIFEKQGKKAEAKQRYEAALKLNPGLKLAAEALKRVS